jgi:hypothetical protein
MSESGSHISDKTGSVAVDAPWPEVASAHGDDSVDLGLALREAKRPPDLSLLMPAPRISAAWLIVPCLACDFLMVPAFSAINGPPAALVVAISFGILGCVLAQGSLLAAWLAWSDGPFLRRLATHWKIAAALYLIWLVGLVLAFIQEPALPHIAATVALGVPLVSIAAQFPLWLVRQLWGWRLVRGPADAALPLEPPLAIRDLLVATLVVAASLALARLAPADGKDVWPIWGVSFVIASVISSIALLPAGPLLLRMQPFSRGIAWGSLYAGIWIVLPWIIVAVVRYYGLVQLPPFALFVGLSGLMFTFAATLILTAAIARDRGYRLTGGRKRDPPGINFGARGQGPVRGGTESADDLVASSQ